MVRLVVSREHVTVVVDRQTVRIRGELDHAARPFIKQAVDETSTDRPVVFELDTVTFVDSEGLACLLEAARRPAGARLATCSRAMRRMLDFTDTADLFSA